jgi:hypothetical protein
LVWKEGKSSKNEKAVSPGMGCGIREGSGHIPWPLADQEARERDANIFCCSIRVALWSFSMNSCGKSIAEGLRVWEKDRSMTKECPHWGFPQLQ